MPRINELSNTDSISSGDLFAMFVQNAGDARKVPLSQLVTYLQSALSYDTGKQVFTTQYAAPNSAGFDIQITDGSDNIWLILTPTTGLADGTITLPAVANVIDKQEILINSTQQVTSITIDGNGANAVSGVPSSFAADTAFKLKYDILTSTWYNISKGQ